ncbi:hypothetical protein GUJ93_ZPchr0012g19635 [Zizania palustris]|uniref:Uncharacterized protein n=1 Tax=Zizania palustris TaxID=103762 RepID=A0A8J5WPK0_ZIZPA|nr:hypothetical protein GUJ93_ZPchr0012g19635 [Zizania palustris]
MSSLSVSPSPENALHALLTFIFVLIGVSETSPSPSPQPPKVMQSPCFLPPLKAALQAQTATILDWVEVEEEGSVGQESSKVPNGSMVESIAEAETLATSDQGTKDVVRTLLPQYLPKVLTPQSQQISSRTPIARLPDMANHRS